MAVDNDAVGVYGWHVDYEVLTITLKAIYDKLKYQFADFGHFVMEWCPFIVRASPYFDASDKDCNYFVAIKEFNSISLDELNSIQVDEWLESESVSESDWKDSIKKLIGYDSPKIYVFPHVW